jgi:hypothetical protein
LIKNEYPITVIDDQFQRFFSRTSRESEPTVPKKKSFLVLPFSNNKADAFAKKLTTFVNDRFPALDFTVAFKSPSEIGKLFPFKDRSKDPAAQSLVVYKIRCNTCDETYIGKTERILAHRIKEHKTHDASAIKQHLNSNPGHEINWNAEIIDTADNDFKLQLKEMLHITTAKPRMNTQHLDKNKDYKLRTIIIGRH